MAEAALTGGLEGVREIVRQYLNVVNQRFHIDRAYLFGSYAQNRARWESDIDLAVISRDFGTRREARTQLFRLTRGVSALIEPLAYRPEDFDNATPADFCHEIKTTGIVVYDAAKGGLLI